VGPVTRPPPTSVSARSPTRLRSRHSERSTASTSRCRCSTSSTWNTSPTATWANRGSHTAQCEKTPPTTSPRRPAPRPRKARPRLQVECLEDRTVPTVFNAHNVAQLRSALATSSAESHRGRSSSSMGRRMRSCRSSTRISCMRRPGSRRSSGPSPAAATVERTLSIDPSTSHGSRVSLRRRPVGSGRLRRRWNAHRRFVASWRNARCQPRRGLAAWPSYSPSTCGT